jgi:V/A-type H+-transporting ATPase subunit I
MHTRMAQVEVTGRRGYLDGVLARLQRAGCAEPVAGSTDGGADGSPDGPDAALRDEVRITVEELTATEADLVRLLDLLPAADPASEPAAGSVAGSRGAGATPDLGVPVDAVPPVRVQQALQEAAEAVADPLRRLRGLREERDTLPATHAGLAQLLPLVPELGSMSDRQLADLRLATIVLVLDDTDASVLPQLRERLTELLGRRSLLVSGPSGPATGCLLVLRSADVPQVEALLGRDHVARVNLPEQYTGRSLRSTVEHMRRRLDELPGLLAAAEDEVADALAPFDAELRAAVVSVRARRERVVAAGSAQQSERAFAARFWVPAAAVAAVRSAVREADPAAVVSTVPTRRWGGRPPVLLHNARVFRPYERLVSFLSWPSPGEIDPTGLMGAVLPVLFGIMVGDIGYGLLLVAAGVLLRRRMAARSPAVADIGRILSLGGAWATVFGALFGELFGDLGEALFGLPALWFYRAGPDALTPLLAFVIGVGAAHLVLGLLIGLWLAARERNVPHLLERGGTLLVLGGLFAVAGVAVSQLPGATLPPALAAVIVGLVLAGWAHGPLGILLGPLEVVGRIGNVLSYLRLAAVGLASAYLAVVANELGRQAPLLLGIVVAAFFHALNLALAAFTPMIQALRLHYVEFFGTFQDGDGRPFHPLGADLPPVLDTDTPAATRSSAACDTALPAADEVGRPEPAGTTR